MLYTVVCCTLLYVVHVVHVVHAVPLGYVVAGIHTPEVDRRLRPKHWTKCGRVDRLISTMSSRLNHNVAAAVILTVRTRHSAVVSAARRGLDNVTLRHGDVLATVEVLRHHVHLSSSILREVVPV